MANRQIVLAFDLYGTLVSTSSISTTLSDVLGVSPEKGDALASRWRGLQLEYSFRITCMGQYVSFRELTRSSLLHVLSEEQASSSSSSAGIVPTTTPGEETLARLMGAYDGLAAFPDAIRGVEVLAKMKAEESNSGGGRKVKAVVFSNGAEETVREAVAKSGLEGQATTAATTVFDGMVSVAPTRAFKPSPQAYRHMVDSTTGGEQGWEVWLVSSNPFDVVGVLGSGIPGLKAAWVDRAGTGWTDSLGGAIGIEKPTMVVRGVDEAAERILNGTA